MAEEIFPDESEALALVGALYNGMRASAIRDIMVAEGTSYEEATADTLPPWEDFELDVQRRLTHATLDGFLTGLLPMLPALAQGDLDHHQAITQEPDR